MKVTIEVPEVPYRGDSKGSQHYFRTAARNLRNDLPAGGSNVRNTIAEMLERVASVMDYEASHDGIEVTASIENADGTVDVVAGYPPAEETGGILGFPILP